jgi:uncharacterized protein GlcG (DUF336 family)
MGLTALPSWVRSGETDCRFCAVAVVVTSISAGVGGWGYQHGDIVTVLGALLLLSAAGLLAAIGLSGGMEMSESSGSGRNTD